MTEQEKRKEQVGNPAMFAQGQLDCLKGLSPQSDDCSYLSGYGFQYELEQIQGALR